MSRLLCRVGLHDWWLSGEPCNPEYVREDCWRCDKQTWRKIGLHGPRQDIGPPTLRRTDAALLERYRQALLDWHNHWWSRAPRADRLEHPRG